MHAVAPETIPAMTKRHGLASMWRRVRVDQSVMVAVFGVFVVALAWMVVSVTAESERRVAIEAATKENANLARAFEEHIVRTIAGVDQVVRLLKHQYEKHGSALDVAGQVRDGAIVSKLFNQLGIVDELGNILLSNVAFKPTNIADREHFRVHAERDTGTLFISKPVLGKVSGKWSIQMTRRVNKPDGSFGGVAVVSVDPFYFSGFYRQVDLGASGLISLAGLDGIVRARQAGSDSQVGQDVSGAAVFQHLKRSPHGSYVANMHSDGIRRIASYRTLADHPFVVLVATSEAEALASYGKRRQAYVAGAAAVSIVVAAFCAVLLTMIARRKRMVSALQAARERAESANRMKSEFLASMSHELRTPLNGILGFAEYLRDELSDETQREYAGIIHDSGSHLLRLVNAILDLAKIEAGRMELVTAEEPLREILEQVIAVHGPAARAKGLELELTLAADLPARFVCDRTRLVQVLNNLLHNAVKFTDHGRVVLAVLRAGSGLHFQVTDTGCGIAPEAQELVFEKFSQGDAFITRSHGGTGLGLALVRQLVELMGGAIALQSARGAGATFSFDLPGDLPVAVAQPLPVAANQDFSDSRKAA